jgi:hypothetical protein
MTNYDTVSQGGGNLFFISIDSPSPLAGEGRVRGLIPNFFTAALGRGRWGEFQGWVSPSLRLDQLLIFYW